MKCKHCRFVIDDFCELHQEKVQLENDCCGKRHAGIWFFRYYYPPWHPIQYAAKIHDQDYETHPCKSTLDIDKKFLNNYLYMIHKFFNEGREKERLLRDAERCYFACRRFGELRKAICKLKRKDTLL